MAFSAMCVGGPLAGRLVNSTAPKFDVGIFPDGPSIINDPDEIAQMRFPPVQMSYVHSEYALVGGAVAFFVPAGQDDVETFSALANGYRSFLEGDTAVSDNLALTMAALIMSAGGEITVPVEIINDGLKGMSIRKHQNDDETAIVYSVTKTEPGKEN